MARFEVQPKAVLGIQAARETPRYAPVSRVRQIQKEATLDEFEADGIDMGTGTTVRRMFTPEQGEGATMFDGSTEEVAEKIVAVLNEKRGG